MEKAMKWIAAAAGAAAGLLTRMPTALRLLVLLMALDYLSGVGVALLGKSPKSEGGALSSRAGFAGLARKAMILVIVLLAAVLDQLTGSAACTGAATMFYIVNESLSILENAVLLGVPVPQRLRQAHLREAHGKDRAGRMHERRGIGDELRVGRILRSAVRQRERRRIAPEHGRDLRAEL